MIEDEVEVEVVLDELGVVVGVDEASAPDVVVAAADALVELEEVVAARPSRVVWNATTTALLVAKHP